MIKRFQIIKHTRELPVNSSEQKSKMWANITYLKVVII